jgi:hypothetical protein
MRHNVSRQGLPSILSDTSLFRCYSTYVYLMVVSNSSSLGRHVVQEIAGRRFPIGTSQWQVAFNLKIIINE